MSNTLKIHIKIRSQTGVKIVYILLRFLSQLVNFGHNMDTLLVVYNLLFSTYSEGIKGKIMGTTPLRHIFLLFWETYWESLIKSVKTLGRKEITGETT